MEKMKNAIMKQLLTVEGSMPIIIYNVVQYDAKYNRSKKRFEIPISTMRTTYFNEAGLSDGHHGIIEGTSVHWEICNGNLTFWLE